MATLVGQTVSHYKILEKLGEGGMGIVYKSEDLKLTRTVALKFLPHSFDATEPERARFLQEARAAAILNHPNVCTVYDIQEHEGEQFIVMEYVEGKTLREMIPVKKLHEAIGYAIQIAEALEEAHARGIVHHDIKSDNIMVNSKNQVKVMDFGLAKLKGSLKLTRTSSTIGTVAYMAPERIQGEEVDARSDIFSFGVVLYEMLTGHRPFRGEHEAAIVYSILNEEPEPLQNHLPDPPSELLHILDRTMEKDREDRYQSPHDLLIDLRRLKKDSSRVLVQPSRQGAAARERAGHRSAASPYRITRIGRYIAALALAAAVFAVVWIFLPAGERRPAGLYPFQTYRPERIATDARPLQAALSPDGRYIIYAADESGKQSVWMRQVSAASSIRILPPEDISYNGFTFSPDGDRVYYTAASEHDARSGLFVVPTLGGTPRKITGNLAGAVGISPDGKHIAFLRRYEKEGEEALMVCAADGTNERKLVSRKGEDFFLTSLGQAPAWSPDGKTIASAAGSVINKFYISVLLVSAADGTSRMATSFRWGNAGRVVWVNEGRGLVITAIEYLTGFLTQLWYADIATGKVRRITTDLNSYDATSLSITADESRLLALQRSFQGALFLLPGGDWRRARQITSRNAYREGTDGLDWTPDGRIVFRSLVSGNPDIWIMDADGKHREQLTTNPRAESHPTVSSDGRLIAYDSEQDTTTHIWRMHLNGSGQEPLTSGMMDDYWPRCAPDSRWVYFFSYRDKGRCNLWKVAADGGDPIKAMDDYVSMAGSISPDGRSFVIRYRQPDDEKWHFGILSLDSGTRTKEFDLPTTASWLLMCWMPDGRSIAFVDTRDGVSNIWVLQLETMKSYQYTHFESELIAGLAWSKDGGTLALVRGELASDVVVLTEAK